MDPSPPVKVEDRDGYTPDVPSKRGSSPRSSRRVSHQDIAREAGVSRVTVSLVLAGKDQTSQETRKRVLEVAKRLRYRPNLLVHGLQTGRSQTIGVIMPVSMHFHGQVARGIHDELVTHDFVPIQLWVNAATDDRQMELEQVHRLVDRRVDGVIVWPADVSVSDVHYHEIWQRNIPLVTVDRETTTHADHVGTDEEQGGRLAAEHLLGLGHRRFAHLTFPNWTGSVLRRGDAFIQAVQRAGGHCEIVRARPEQMLEPVKRLLARPDRPTALFAAIDPMAMSAYAAAEGLDLDIPNNFSIVGYADFPFARDLYPPLTTVRQDPYQMGRLAAQILLDRILERTPSEGPRRIHLKPELILRESTTSVARGERGAQPL
jgi:LacI family transcriptional regulator